MPMSEACALWVEQRVKEELEAGKGYREIGREIAAEIERVFETKVNPETIRKRAERLDGGTNVPPAPTIGDVCGKVATSGDKLTPEKIVEKVDALVEKGLSTREAAKSDPGVPSPWGHFFTGPRPGPRARGWRFSCSGERRVHQSQVREQFYGYLVRWAVSPRRRVRQLAAPFPR